jgi:hypothetical protein
MRGNRKNVRREGLIKIMRKRTENVGKKGRKNWTRKTSTALQF